MIKGNLSEGSQVQAFFLEGNFLQEKMGPQKKMQVKKLLFWKLSKRGS